jgi:mono/diheme cytochrome c family protein
VRTDIGSHQSGSTGRSPGLRVGISRAAALAVGIALAGLCQPGLATASTDAAAAEKALYAKGKSSFRKRCARCHGVNMVNPGAGIYDLRDFPEADRDRFIQSVTYGKNAMPSWQDVLKPEDIEALWVYVTGNPAPDKP